MGLRAQQYYALSANRLQAVNLTEAISHAEAEAARLDSQVSQLEIRSQIAGKMVLARQDDMLGTWLKKGQLLGYVLGSGEFIVRAVVAHQDAPQILQHVRSTEIRLEERPTDLLSGQILRTVPAATNLLPVLPWQTKGGAVVTDRPTRNTCVPSNPSSRLMCTAQQPHRAHRRTSPGAFQFRMEPLAFSGLTG